MLNGINDDGSVIKEFEASHGTVTDMWYAHLRGEETSLNPLSMMEALIGAMLHSAHLEKSFEGFSKDLKKVENNENYVTFVKKLQTAIHTQVEFI